MGRTIKHGDYELFGVDVEGYSYTEHGYRIINPIPKLNKNDIQNFDISEEYIYSANNYNTKLELCSIDGGSTVETSSN